MVHLLYLSLRGKRTQSHNISFSALGRTTMNIIMHVLMAVKGGKKFRSEPLKFSDYLSLI